MAEMRYQRRYWSDKDKLSPRMCLVFSQDITEDGSLFRLLETPSVRYLLKDTNTLFLSVNGIWESVSREDPPPKIRERQESILWSCSDDAELPQCPTNTAERVVYYPNTLRLVTRFIVLRRDANVSCRWRVDSCNFRQLSSFCKKLQRQIDCKVCPSFPCFSKLADKWFQSIDFANAEPENTIWQSWLDTRDENTSTDKKIVYLQKNLGAGHSSDFEFVHPNDTRDGPFQKNIRSFTEHSWDTINKTKETKKKAAADGQETKRLKKELCPACVFSNYCERWSLRNCNGPCTKEHVLAETQYWLQENDIKDADREKLALIASVSDHTISRIFRHSVTIGRMAPHLDRVKTHTRRNHDFRMFSPADILLLLRANRDREWFQQQQEWARAHPMSDEALAMYIELCQPTQRWIGLGAGYFGAIRSIMAVEYRGDTRFNMVFSSGCDMSFDGFGSLYRLKHEFALWQYWKSGGRYR